MDTFTECLWTKNTLYNNMYLNHYMGYRYNVLKQVTLSGAGKASSLTVLLSLVTTSQLKRV